MRFPLEVVRRSRELVGADFPIVYRISLLDLVERGQTWDEVVELAHLLEEAGVTVLNTGIGWHEARVPTIITQVPPGAWRSATARLKAEVSVPVCASNRINTPELAESILAAGEADLVSMARPLLADADFVNKAAAGRADEINTCIACNQACLDHVFVNKKASCLVNPRACRETELVLLPLPDPRPRGRGRRGRRRPGRAVRRGVGRRARVRGDAVREVRVDRRPVPAGDAGARQGGLPRDPALLHPPARGARRRRPARHRGHRRRPRGVRRGGRRHRRRAADPRARRHRPPEGRVVRRRAQPPGRPRPRGWPWSAPAGSASTSATSSPTTRHSGTTAAATRTPTHDDWMAHWGVGDPAVHPGGLTERKPRTPVREVTLVQRKTTPIGIGLGKTSGWAHRAVLKQSGVEQVSGATYDRVDDDGLHVTVDGEQRVLDVDHVVLCAGQESVRGLYDGLVGAGRRPRT